MGVDPHNQKDAPVDFLATDWVIHHTSEVPVVAEPSGASSQSPPPPNGNDSGSIESHEKTKVDDDTGDDTATVTGHEHDSTSNAVAKEVQTVKANNQVPPFESQLVPKMKKQLDTRPISLGQLVDEIKGIYAGFVMLERKCVELVPNLMPPTDDPLDITKYLLMIPEAKLVLLQNSETRPTRTVRTWYLKVHKDAAEGDKKPSATLGSTKKDSPATGEDLSTTPSTTTETLPTASKDSAAATSEETLSHPHVSEKITPQVGTPEDYLHGFQVALESRAKELGWPEYEEIAAATTAEIGDEGRQKVIDGKYFLALGYELVDQILRDLESAKEKEAAPEEIKSESEEKPETKLPCDAEFRQLSDQSLYKKVGSEYWVLIKGQWVPSLNAEQLAVLMLLHRTLLHETHDFFLASQHPSAPAALKGLAVKYAIPKRMWKFGIQSFLDVMVKRHVECGDHMASFIILAYQMVSLLDESVPRFYDIWIECKADLARYGMATQSNDEGACQRWHDIAKEEFTRAHSKNPTTGRIYHHLAVVAWPRTRVSRDKAFEASVSQFFYYTKALVVKVPFFPARQSVLFLIKTIVARNETDAEKPASRPQTDKDHFLTAVSHLILASLEPETLRKNGYKDRRSDHVQAVYAALEKIKIGAASSKTSRIRPSPQLGLLLCHLLLGIPLVDKRWSPMMAAWAPDLVTAADRADSDAMANARDIHEVTIELIRTMVPYLLEEADTRDLRLWGFIYVMLVFMRSLKTRPDLLEWFGSAFQAQLLAPFLNMLLREDEARGAVAWNSAFQSSELVTICSLLNEKKKLDKYGLSTEDSRRKYLCEQEEQRKAELSKAKGEAKDATASDTAHEKDLDTETPDWELMYANTLPEHSLLAGHFFAREAEPEPCDKSVEKPAGDAAAPDATPAAAVQTAKEAEEAEVRRQEGLRRDPPLFPHGWLERSKYDYGEIQVRSNYVQDAESYDARSIQLLRLAAQLNDYFFVFGTDNEGRYWISVPGASSVPMPDPNKKMPEIVERDGGVRVVYVHPSFLTAEMKMEKKRAAREEKRQKEKERQKEEERQKEDEAKATTDVATDVNKKAEGDVEEAPEAVNVPAVAPNTTASEDGDHDHEPSSAYEMDLDKTIGLGKTTVAAEPTEAEPTEAKPETTLPMRTKGNDAGPDAAAARVPLNEGVLDNMPRMENPVKAIKRWRASSKEPGAEDEDEDKDEEEWERLSNESHGDAKVETRSMFSRFFFG
ncbi:hypothetical protein AYO21_11516 [Fonsecaea monophora]|uniref:DNA/RNA-binding domain-containing protein n=1 Tax=Fonsecaea monophora TaxID=254056 RepID=A0A177ERQ8_9EURO|nr:hypothetical protein AYO21_11516 [Fonsecaea monophora]KAH0829997.1 hypothetical protein FOPE_10094 [Fonsecaea pedrosoi]OAG34336.1 hypothetical protein AYO21_11516 [Fonsecaea monophora]